jgi:hypothetical protein
MQLPRFPTLLVVATLVTSAGAAEAQSLRGSRASIDRIYGQARSHDLTFYRTSTSVRNAAKNGELVRLEPNANLRLYDVSYPYTLPTSRTFIYRLAGQYRDACGERMVVTSATRPKSLRLLNSTAKSVHPAGMAIDIRRPTRGSCLRWLRNSLVELNRTKAIEAVEERHPPHFHVAVFPRPYLAYLKRRGVSTGKLAAAMATGSGDGGTYKVRRGDSLWAIARRHNTTVDRLRSANGIRSSTLQPGQVLQIPAGG